MNYTIGGHRIKITTSRGDSVLNTILPSFIPFQEKNESEKDYLFHLKIEDVIKKTPNDEFHLIKDVDTGNGKTQVGKLRNGGYQFIINNITGKECGITICDKPFRNCVCQIRGTLGQQRFALNNILMMIYAFSSVKFNTLLVHASVIRYRGEAIAFTAKSGTGKSTQVANWLSSIEGCDMINDDNPILRIETDKSIRLYGSPWSGKTCCYRNTSAPLKSLVLIKRDEKNYVNIQQPIVAFSTLLSGCSAMRWDEDLFQSVCSIISQIVETITVAELHCTPKVESATVCKNYFYK